MTLWADVRRSLKTDRWGPRLSHMLAVAGPGLVVMLADTDAGSVITAAQSGAQWGYRLLLLQFLIIPVLFMTQELTIRLALWTQKGLAELILLRFGRFWTFVSLATLLVSCFGALVTEMSGLAGVGQMFGVPAWATVASLATLIVVMVATGSYRSVERMAILLGLFELAFLIVAWKARPDGAAILDGLVHAPLGNGGYLYLLAANIGTSIMPWTVFYQQSAIVDKNLHPESLRFSRLDTFVGAVICQSVTAAVLVAAAATIGRSGGGTSLENVPHIAMAFTPSLGDVVGRIVFAVGLSGGAIVATIVVCLTSAWAIGEVTGARHSLADGFTEAPGFYLALGLPLLAGGAFVASGIDLVRLSIATGVANALLLPVVLGFVFFLARTALPERVRPGGLYGAVLAIVFVLTSGIGLYAAVVGVLS